MNGCKIKSYLLLAALPGLALICGCRMSSDKLTQTFSSGRRPFGTVGKDLVEQFILANNSGMEVRIINYGATITDILVPDRNGKAGNVVLGFDSLNDYLQTENPYFGATIGRYANRIANARFRLNGKEYALDANNNGNTLHGGFKGLDKVIWQPVALSDSSVKFSYLSLDGEGGFPGSLQVEVTFSITSENELIIQFMASAAEPTPVNLTGHSYFNLSAGADSTILNHELKLFANRYTPVNEQLIPTGELLAVNGTPYDFTTAKPIGRDLPAVTGGYDHNFVLEDHSNGLKPAAELVHPASGRALRILTTYPGIQFYSGNFLNGTLVGRGGVRYQRHAGLCLEPQYFPDSPNRPEFPDTILKPGQTYNHTIVYQFFTQ